MADTLQAHWFQGPYRWRGIDDDGDPGSWSYAPFLADVKTGFAESDYDTGDVEKFETRSGVRHTLYRKMLVARCSGGDPIIRARRVSPATPTAS